MPGLAFDSNLTAVRSTISLQSDRPKPAAPVAAAGDSEESFEYRRVVLLRDAVAGVADFESDDAVFRDPRTRTMPCSGVCRRALAIRF